MCFISQHKLSSIQQKNCKFYARYEDFLLLQEAQKIDFFIIKKKTRRERE